MISKLNFNITPSIIFITKKKIRYKDGESFPKKKGLLGRKTPIMFHDFIFLLIKKIKQMNENCNPSLFREAEHAI